MHSSCRSWISTEQASVQTKHFPTEWRWAWNIFLWNLNILFRAGAGTKSSPTGTSIGPKHLPTQNKSVLSLVVHLSTCCYLHLLLSMGCRHTVYQSKSAARARTQQQTSHTPLHCGSTRRTNRRTDSQPLHRWQHQYMNETTLQKLPVLAIQYSTAQAAATRYIFLLLHRAYKNTHKAKHRCKKKRDIYHC